ncbi:hemerythrin domain-containing protein [Streptomyces orinoci]|uniref:Hemerythrin domain-containing protein n=1 Tax=Streptomyces orinoci TaxID=67339 RepID=A0ABV3K6M3_STRON|nr:hemerythrin domain-containing protein [Streptomyces orinoci]
MPPNADLITELTADHRVVQRLFDRIRAAPPGSAERGELVERVTMELVAHSAVEKEHLYPAVRDHLPDGAGWVERELADHDRVERILRELEELEPGDEEFARLLPLLVAQVTTHVLEQEQRLFPRLGARCPTEVLAELGEKVRRSRRLVPTRPRPGIPDLAPVTKAVSPGLGLLDRIRDRLTGRARRRMD